MGMSASQARLLSLTARLSDLELQAQTIGNAKIRLADESAEASRKYNEALDMKILKIENGSDGTYSDASLSNVATYGGINLSGTNSQFRYITDSSNKLVMTASQLTGLGATGVNTTTTPPTFTPPAGPVDAYINGRGIPYDTSANGTAPFNAFSPTIKASPAYQFYADMFAKLSTGQVTIVTSTEAQDPQWLERQVRSGNLFLNEYKSNEGATGTGGFREVSWVANDDSIHEEDDKYGLARAEAQYETTMADIQSKDKRFDLQLKTIDTEHTAIQTEIDSVKKVINKNIERSFKIFDA